MELLLTMMGKGRDRGERENRGGVRLPGGHDYNRRCQCRKELSRRNTAASIRGDCGQDFVFPQRNTPGLYEIFRPLGGRGECRVPAHPQPRV